MIYGEPRLTHDIDLVVEIAAEDAASLVRLFEPDQFYCPPTEVVQAEASNRSGHFNIIHHKSGFKADIYPAGDDQLHKWAMAHRKQANIRDCDIWVAPPEYVIIRKLEYFREGGSVKHLHDIKRMLEVSAELIDMNELDSRIMDRGLLKEWKLAQDII